MSLWSTYGTDKEESWIDLPDDNGVDVRFKLAYPNGSNCDFTKEFEKEIRPHRRRLRKGQVISTDIMREAKVKVFCKTVLKDWENVLDREGEPIPFSEDAAIQLLTALPVLYDILEAEASSISNFQTEALADEAKNS